MGRPDISDATAIEASILCVISTVSELGAEDYLNEPWFTAELATAHDDTTRRGVWTVLAYRIAAALCRKTAPAAAWRLARICGRSARLLLAVEVDPRRRQAMEAVLVGSIGFAGEAAASLGHPLARAVAAALMCRVIEPLDNGDPARVALAVENVLPLLIERGRVREARDLVDAVPARVAEAHPNWAAVRKRANLGFKAPWEERGTRVEVVAGLQLEVERLFSAEDAELRAMAERFLRHYAEDGDLSHILRLAELLTEKASALGDADPAAPLRLRAQLLHRDLLDDKQADPSGNLTELKAIEAAFVRAKAWDDVATSRLSLGHAYAHLGDDRAAIGWFVAAIEAQAKLGSDPGIPALTAGNAEQLRPYYEALIHALIDVGHHRAAFLVAEHCKGELWRRVRPEPSRDLAELVHEPAVDQSLAGVIAYFVDSEGVILFWTTSDGVAHSARMGIPRARLEAYVTAVRANGWRPVGLFTPSNAAAIRALGGLLRPAGHDLLHAMPDRLTISPDGILHNVPWHLLQVGPASLIERHSVRTVLCLDHAAFVSQPGQAEMRRSVVTVPSVSDCESDWARWATAVGAAIAPAGESVNSISGGEGTLGALTARIHDFFLHVRCHGHFPEGAEVTAEDAYGHSGLLLAESGLPERRIDAPLAAPRDFMELGIVRARASGHIALEACVSGIVHDGAAGDPVSLPWVLALQGVRTVITLLWNVETAHAEAFFSCYYAEMIGQRRSAGEAHRIATLQMLERFGPAAAAFRLLGNDL